jgi:hypothetical protein
MTDRDERLEAVALEVARYRDLAFWPECDPKEKPKVYAIAAAHLAWYDAIRAFDEQRLPTGGAAWDRVCKERRDADNAAAPAASPAGAETVEQFPVDRGGAPEPKRSIFTGNLAHPNGCYHCGYGKKDCICPGVHGTSIKPPAGADPRLAARDERLRQIRTWCDAYPVDVFPEPDLAAAKAALGDDLYSSLHAAWARRLLKAIRDLTEPVEPK